MKNMEIAGTGNSRYLRSALTAATTWEEAREMLIAGTFPIDFAGLNAAGVLQEGTPFNVDSVLKDSTAALLGGDASMVPDDAFRALFESIDIYKELETFGTAGAYEFVVPENIHNLLVFVVSGGSSGHAIRTTFSSLRYYEGGGSGNLGVFRFDVEPGDTFAVVVGAGGAAVSSTGNIASSVAGGSSAFGGKTVSGSAMPGVNPYGNETLNATPSIQNRSLTEADTTLAAMASLALMYAMYGDENLLTNLAAGGGGLVNSSNAVTLSQPAVTLPNGKKTSGVAGGTSSKTATKGTDYGCGGGTTIVAASSGTAKSAAGMNGVVAVWGY